ncbi:sulfite exporter TauE/SafE family protein [Noviherbaspirillum pedocola]|uniref:Probable membrane transporter protein n=1 Tax=Noviherbaspirillum pedocola TaxID=2801341 RepID=A0A934STU0_9BURK|nr:sulfite exporter TauE/SafE family protein [Noviherbaspirillum pedocola]MBK4735081.1 sulfite exporter TauE/SafE family protein [Noviherbaspirillum pedocola]
MSSPLLAPLAFLANFALGAGLGVAGGLLGIGGGLIAIPIISWLYGMDQHLAQGTALVMIVPNVLIGFWRYHQKHRIDLRSVAVMSLFSMLSTWIAARFATGMASAHLQLAFAAFLTVLALWFAWRLKAESAHEVTAGADGVAAARPTSARALPLIGIASGAMSGIFTVGGGLVVVPALVALFRMPQTRAQGMALALVVPGALIALATYAHAGHVDWSTGIALAAGGVVSVSRGVKLAHRFRPHSLRLLFCAVLLATAAMTLAGR